MRKFYLFLFAMMSLSVSIASAQQWSQIVIPYNGQALAISNSQIFVFDEGVYHFAETPLSENSLWQSQLLPENTAVKSAEVAMNNLFVLFENGRLYEKGSDWQMILEGVNGISSIDEKLFAWSNDFVFEYEQGLWQYQEQFEGALYIAGGNGLIVATEYSLYQGPRLNQLSLIKTDINIRALEVKIFDSDYVYVGEAIGGLAAYHKSPLDACYLYDRVMTSGQLNSAVLWNGRVLLSGYLNNAGIIFDADDMSRLSLFEEKVKMMKANDYSVVALAGNHLYYQSNTSTSTATFTKEPIVSEPSIKVAPNPVADGTLKLLSNRKDQAQVFNVKGNQVSHLFIEEGQNLFNVSSWPAGLYIIRPLSQFERGIKFVIR